MFMTGKHQRRTVGAFVACLAGLALTMAHPAAIQVVRFTATGGQRVTAADPAEILVWEMHATVG